VAQRERQSAGGGVRHATALIYEYTAIVVNAANQPTHSMDLSPS
jgi:hypothetical protein